MRKTKTLLVLASTLCVFNFFGVKSVNAEASSLNAGSEFAISGVSGNLNNINIKVEFTSSVNLDGTNNALLVGLAAADGTILSDEKFVGASTNAGVFDENSVAISFVNAPGAIGSKTSVESNYKYSFETRDFTIVNGEKNIAKLVVIGQKGSEISTEISFSEVKYSVKFGALDEIEYSYNATIADPVNPPQYTFDIDGHKALTGWTGDDSSSFVSGSTKATKDIVYTANYGDSESHKWGNEIAEVAATLESTGVKAHYVCSDCGAIKADGVIVSEKDLVIQKLNHTHNYSATFDWTNAKNPGDKPVVNFTCQDSTCKDSHDFDASEITVNEKADSRHNSTCTQKGSVTYVASATYEETTKTDEHEFELALANHTLTPHAAVASTFETEGNVKYWTCSECNGYFLDENGTQVTTADGVVLPKLSLEEAQIVSLSDITDGKYFDLFDNKSYSYTFTKPNKSTSIQFKWLVNEISDDHRMKFHNYFCGEDKWNSTSMAWFVADQDKIGVTENGKINFYAIDDVKTGLHSVEFTTQAIMCGDVATGNYMVTVKFDGAIAYQYTQAYDVSKMTANLFINSTSRKNYLYDISYTGDTLEEADVIDVYDINVLGRLSNISSGTHYEYSTDSTNYSRVFRFKLTPDVLDSKSEFFVDLGTGNACRVWSQPGSKKNLFFAWNVDGHWTDRYWIGGQGGDSKALELVAGQEYEIEMGRIKVTDGIFEGKDIIYIKVNGEYLFNYHQPSWFYCASTSNPLATNKIDLKLVNYTMKDVNYVEPQFETADVITVTDLVSTTGSYLTEQVDIYTPGLNNYSYTGFSTYGSVVFKGTLNFSAASFDNGDNHGSQFRFANDWGNEGMIWLHPNGILIPANGGYLVGSKIPLGSDVAFEVGRLAIMDGETFTGKHYFYVKLNGVIANEYVSSSLTEEAYSKKVLSFTGKATNEGNTIKAVSNNKTVTIKVGSHSEDVTVSRSGLISMPTFGTEVVAADKRIVGWTIEGTETAFNPLADRIFNDMVIVATVDDFKWKITFTDVEDSFVKNGEDITLPTTNPTKASDATNHYVFVCWLDANGDAFVAGTKATADATYTAKFNTVAHSFGEWQVITAETCTTAGLKKQVCECGYEVTAEIPAAHKLVKVDAKAATCASDGNIEYYMCSVCGLMFTDANGVNQVTIVTIPAHGLVHHDAKTSNCTSYGNIEYWECTTCHKYYKDALATQQVSDSDILVAPHHVLTKVAAKDPTCSNDGNIEYYHCSECNKNFSDAEGKNSVSKVKVAATGEHAFGDNHKCTVCGELDPDYEEDNNKEEPSSNPFKDLFAGCNGAAIPSVFGLLTIIGALLVSKKRRA